MLRKILCFVGLCFVGVTLNGGTGIDADDIFRRGDSNNDGTVNVTDVSFLYNFLFLGGAEPPCMNQADVNHDGDVDVSDPTYLNNWLFLGGPVPPAPGPYASSCSNSSSPYISCDSSC